MLHTGFEKHQMTQISLAYCPSANAWILNYSAKNIFFCEMSGIYLIVLP